MFEFDSKIRFSETDEQLTLTLPALLNYFQDCSTFQSEIVGDTIENLKKNNRAWVLVKWQVEINRLPKLRDDVVIGTIPYSFQSFGGKRNYYMKSADGEMLAYADTSWTFLNLEDAKFSRVEESIKSLYPVGEKLEMPKVKSRITFDGEPTVKTTVRFSAADQDTNHHVNNVKTVAHAWALVETDGNLVRMRTEYRKQLFGGDEITACVYKNENIYVVTFENSDGELTTLCEFTIA